MMPVRLEPEALGREGSIVDRILTVLYPNTCSLFRLNVSWIIFLNVFSCLQIFLINFFKKSNTVCFA